MLTTADVVIFHLKRIWTYDSAHRPNENDKCAKCGHTFLFHTFRGEDTNCGFVDCHCRGFRVNLYEEIKAGRKTSEWRDASDYWLKRFCTLPVKKVVDLVKEKPASLNIVPLPTCSKSKAWFTIGYPKNNLPRLEADIFAVFLHRDTQQLEIQIQNVREITSVNRSKEN